MKNIIFLAILFVLGGSSIVAQSTDPLRWIVPLQVGGQIYGVPGTTSVGFKTGDTIALATIDGSQKIVPADSISWIQDDWWTIWRQGLKGIFHTKKGVIIPCVYETVDLAVSDTHCWAFQVSKYGMVGLVNDRNQLIQPWQEWDFSNCRFVSDTVMEYTSKISYRSTDKKYVSINGVNVPENPVYLDRGGSFHRISIEQYVFSWNNQGVIRRDTFSSVSDFVNGVAPVRKPPLWGYIRKDGSWLIPPSFQEGTSFDEWGLAKVKINEKFGIIRSNGTWVLKPVFEKITPKNAILFEFIEKKQKGLIDSTGRELIRVNVDQKIMTSENGMFGIQMADSIQLYNRKGELMPVNQVKDCAIKGDLANITSRNSSPNKPRENIKGIFDFSSGKWLLPQVYTGIVVLTEYFIILETKIADGQSAPGIDKSESGKYLLFNRKGELILPVKLDKIPQPGKNPYVVFRANNKSGLVFKNKVVLEAIYDEINVLPRGWLSVRQGQKWGVVKL